MEELADRSPPLPLDWRHIRRIRRRHPAEHCRELTDVVRLGLQQTASRSHCVPLGNRDAGQAGLEANVSIWELTTDLPSTRSVPVHSIHTDVSCTPLAALAFRPDRHAT